jgi:hypothetical protein
MRGRGTDLFAVFVILEEVQEDELERRRCKKTRRCKDVKNLLH